MVLAALVTALAFVLGILAGSHVTERIMKPAVEGWRKQAYDLLAILHRRIEGDRRAADEITAIMNDATAGCPACRDELVRRVRDAAFAKDGANAPGGDA